MTTSATKLTIISTNIGERKQIRWKGKNFDTGIFKYPTTEGIFLGKEDVQKDNVIDRKYHGGVDKACYIYPYNHYPYWKGVYTDLDWELGMFGENITIDGFDETKICIGDTFKIGDAIVQVSEPRQPCSTLNMRFDSSKMVKDFVAFGHCGAYLRVLEEGHVKQGDELQLLEKDPAGITLHEIFLALYPNNSVSKERYAQMLALPALGEACKENLKKHLNGNS